MITWPYPEMIPAPGNPAPLQLFDTADQTIRPVEVPATGPVGVYVCGITPYDSTHLGHAATYLTFDLIIRQLEANGHRVHYAQNVTDVDDPLFERAVRDGVDWRELGQGQIEKFRGDMTALEVIPPKDFVGAMEAIDEIIEFVRKLLDCGAAYVVDDPKYPDIYARVDATEHFGYESNYTPEQMRAAFAECGGDPDRTGKKNELDALLWRAHREGEPEWDSPFGPGRPGWHVECSAIAANRLGVPFAIQGGGSDLAFPHHEFSAAHAEAALGVDRMAEHYVHTGMIGLEGTKMSKSLGNLVFVKDLVDAGHDPSAIRLGVFAGHYRSHRDWSPEVLREAEERLAKWRAAARAASDNSAALRLVDEVRGHLANDLDTPAALAAIDRFADKVLAASTGADNVDDTGSHDADPTVSDALWALLGVRV